MYSGLPGLVTVLWGLYNCIGPYLLLHYAYIGRRRSLATASMGGMGAALGLALMAVALLVAFTPTAHDFAQVRICLRCTQHEQLCNRAPASARAWPVQACRT